MSAILFLIPLIAHASPIDVAKCTPKYDTWPVQMEKNDITRPKTYGIFITQEKQAGKLVGFNPLVPFTLRLEDPKMGGYYFPSTGLKSSSSVMQKGGLFKKSVMKTGIFGGDRVTGVLETHGNSRKNKIFGAQLVTLNGNDDATINNSELECKNLLF